MIKIYLVGGAVRDKLLGLKPKDKDWVVVGATREEMLKLGYTPIKSSQGFKDFPVFLHPDTKEEYALARREKRTGSGHTGFDFDISPTITLLDDLKRRDLTVNAMAIVENELGELIDPFNGQDDLKRRILRHVSPAFIEDPLRLIRTARFAACLDFHVASETMILMRQMVAEGKLRELQNGQIWKELNRALMGAHPENFFNILKMCGADVILFPQMKIPGPGIKALQLSAGQMNSASVRFAVLMHDMDKDKLSRLCKQFSVPSQYHNLALLTSKWLPQFQRLPELEAKEILDLLAQIGAFSNKERFDNCLKVFELCTQEPSYIEQIRKAFKAAVSMNTKELTTNYIGAEISKKIKKLRIEAIQECINSSWLTNRC